MMIYIDWNIKGIYYYDSNTIEEIGKLDIKERALDFMEKNITKFKFSGLIFGKKLTKIRQKCFY